MSFKGAKWDSDALGNTYDELFKNKNPARKSNRKMKNTEKLKTSILQLSKKKKKLMKTNSESNIIKSIGNFENSESISKSKKKRLKKSRTQQKQQNLGEMKINNRSSIRRNTSARETIGKHKISPMNHTEMKNVTLNSGDMKTEYSKKKKKSRNLKKRLQAAVQQETFMNHVNIDHTKERESLITKKQIEALSKFPKIKLNSHHSVNSPTINKKTKFIEKLKHVLAKPSEKKPLPTLRQKMLDKLKAARFRFLNEQIYSTDSKEAQKIFQSDPEAFKTYHEGYRKQVKRWPLNPLDIIIKSIKKMPKTHVIADFGCGDAKLSKTVSQKVFSFDLVSADETVISCDMSKVPLDDGSVDVAVFCLSLMGTNLHDYLLEANRVLKIGGHLKIAEVESRFENVSSFIKGVQHFGFKNTWKDLSHNLFYFIDFKKNKDVKNKKKAPTLTLLPCLYKKR